ncbi:MAG: hypothetical protein H6685_04680 [Deltaproteobacteria bacterium]|nr:hypothetical protein [Deltaproteobacteria bacterium]
MKAKYFYLVLAMIVVVMSVPLACTEDDADNGEADIAEFADVVSGEDPETYCAGPPEPAESIAIEPFKHSCYLPELGECPVRINEPDPKVGTGPLGQPWGVHEVLVGISENCHEQIALRYMYLEGECFFGKSEVYMSGSLLTRRADSQVGLPIAPTQYFASPAEANEETVILDYDDRQIMLLVEQTEPPGDGEPVIVPARIYNGKGEVSDEKELQLHVEPKSAEYYVAIHKFGDDVLLSLKRRVASQTRVFFQRYTKDLDPVGSLYENPLPSGVPEAWLVRDDTIVAIDVGAEKVDGTLTGFIWAYQLDSEFHLLHERTVLVSSPELEVYYGHAEWISDDEYRLFWVREHSHTSESFTLYASRFSKDGTEIGTVEVAVAEEPEFYSFFRDGEDRFSLIRVEPVGNGCRDIWLQDMDVDGRPIGEMKLLTRTPMSVVGGAGLLRLRNGNLAFAFNSFDDIGCGMDTFLQLYDANNDPICP